MLKKFEGLDVIGAAMQITRAGDGLSEALQLAPKAYKKGQKVTLLLEGTVDGINHKGVKDTDAVTRVHVLRTERIVEVPIEDAKAYFEAEEARLEALRDEKDGVSRLPLNDDPLGVFGGTTTPTPEQAAAEAQAAADESAAS